MSRKGDVLLLFTCGGEEISEGNGGQRVERHNGGWVGGHDDGRSMDRSTESCDSWLWPVSTAWFGIEPWAFLGTFWEESKVQKM